MNKHTYALTYSNAQIHSSTRTHTHTHKQTHTPHTQTITRNPNVNLLLTVFFDFFYFPNIFPSLPDDCQNNTAIVVEAAEKQTSYIYIYIYILYIYIYIYIYIYRQHFLVNANFIKHKKHFMRTYFLLDPFEFPYYFYRIRGELILGIVHSCMYP